MEAEADTDPNTAHTTCSERLSLSTTSACERCRTKKLKVSHAKGFADESRLRM